MRPSSVPEVLGDAGVLLDLGGRRWLGDEPRRDNRTAGSPCGAGGGRTGAAASFTWERTARETYEVYLRAVGSMIDISVIVVNWNGRHHLQACLDAVLAQQGVEFETLRRGQRVDRRLG